MRIDRDLSDDEASLRDNVRNVLADCDHRQVRARITE